MSKIDKIRVNNVDYDIVSGDNLPVGAEVDFDGQVSDIPTGWEEVEEYPKLLWTNPNNDQAFAGQTVNLATNDCNVFDIYYKMGLGHYYIKVERVVSGATGLITIPATSGFSNNTLNRTITNISSSSITFADGYEGGSVSATRNEILIPLYIVGYKIPLS